MTQEKNSSKENALGEIEALRKEIDSLDKELVALLAKRMDTALKIARVKQESGVEAGDQDRVEEVVKRVVEAGQEQGLDKDGLEQLWRVLIKCTIDEQMRRYPYKTKSMASEELRDV